MWYRPWWQTLYGIERWLEDGLTAVKPLNSQHCSSFIIVTIMVKINCVPLCGESCTYLHLAIASFFGHRITMVSSFTPYGSICWRVYLCGSNPKVTLRPCWFLIKAEAWQDVDPAVSRLYTTVLLYSFNPIDIAESFNLVC